MFWMCGHDARCVLVQVDGFLVNPDNDKANRRKKVFLTTDEGWKCESMMRMRNEWVGKRCIGKLNTAIL